jgi:hypothetical protein
MYGYCVIKLYMVSGLITFLDGCNFQTHLFHCSDGKKCMDRLLLCDGYPQCDDGSDEMEHMCQDCKGDHGGYPGVPNTEKNFIASFSCKHRYTTKWICAAPCDGRDGLCENFEDEKKCQQETFLELLAYIGLPMIVVILALETVRSVVRYFRGDSVKKDKSIIVLTNNELTLLGVDLEAEYGNLRGQPEFGEALLNLIQCNQSMQSFSEMDTICHECYKLEETEQCIISCSDASSDVDTFFFKTLGTNNGTMHFYDHVRNSTFVKFRRYISSNGFMSNFGTSLLFQKVSGIIRMGLGILLHYTDIVKDLSLVWHIYNLVQYNPDPYYMLVIHILIATIVVSEVLNLLVLLQHPVFYSWNLLTRVFAVALIPAVPAAVLYQEFLLTETIQKSVRRLKCQSQEITKQSIDEANLVHARKVQHSLLSLRAEFCANENVFEHFIQLVVLSIMLIISSPENHFGGFGHYGAFDTEGLASLTELFVNQNRVFVIVSSILSILSLVIGHCFFLKTQKCQHLGLLGTAISMTYFLFGTLVRYLYFIMLLLPTFDLFNVLMHQWMGQLPSTKLFANPTFDVLSNSNTINLSAAWKPLRYGGWVDMDGWHFFWQPPRFFLLAITCLVFLLRILSGIYFQFQYLPKATTMFKRIIYSLYCLIWPPVWNDWEDIHRQGDISVSASWHHSRVLFHQFICLFTLEHIVLSFPVMVLKYQVDARNKELNEAHFPPLKEEMDST